MLGVSIVSVFHMYAPKMTVALLLIVRHVHIFIFRAGKLFHLAFKIESSDLRLHFVLWPQKDKWLVELFAPNCQLWVFQCIDYNFNFQQNSQVLWQFFFTHPLLHWPLFFLFWHFFEDHLFSQGGPVGTGAAVGGALVAVRVGSGIGPV